MKHILFLIFLSFFCAHAHEKLDPQTKESISDVYDQESVNQLKIIEAYFAFQAPEKYEDATILNPSEGQMEDGYMVVMTEGAPLKMRSKWGTYTFNNCSSVLIDTDSLQRQLKKSMGARVKTVQCTEKKKTTLFTVTQFDAKKLPAPKERKPADYVRPEEALHAFQVQCQVHADAQAVKDFLTEYGDGRDNQDIVAEWQPIQKKNYGAEEYKPTFFPIFSLEKCKSIMSWWYLK